MRDGKGPGLEGLSLSKYSGLLSAAPDTVLKLRQALTSLNSAGGKNAPTKRLKEVRAWGHWLKRQAKQVPRLRLMQAEGDDGVKGDGDAMVKRVQPELLADPVELRA